MPIIPCGKSNLFNSELDEFKNKYVAQYAKEALDSIPRLEVDGQRHVYELPEDEYENKSSAPKDFIEKVLDVFKTEWMPMMTSYKDPNSKDPNEIEEINRYINDIRNSPAFIEIVDNCYNSNKYDLDSSAKKAARFVAKELKYRDTELYRDVMGFPEEGSWTGMAKVENKSMRKQAKTHEACGCGGNCVDEVVIKKKRKKDMPLRKVVKEGDEMEASASVDPKYISLAELKQTFSKMDKLDKDKIYAFWSEILGEDFAKALVKEYF